MNKILILPTEDFSSALTHPVEQLYPVVLWQTSALDLLLICNFGIACPILWNINNTYHTWSCLTLPVACNGCHSAIHNKWQYCNANPQVWSTHPINMIADIKFWSICRYHSLPILHPPHIAHYFESKVGGGLYSNIQLVSTVCPHKHTWMRAKSHDDVAVAIQRNSSNIGHAPQESPQVCWYFLQKSGSEITCSRQWWQEMKVDWVTRMCVYVFRGQRKH